MTTPKIARTLAEAEVGDLVWEAQARRGWEAVPVRKVGRVYVHVGGTQEYQHTWQAYHKDTGYAQTVRDYTPQGSACGYEERQSREMMAARRALSRMIEDCEDQRTLRDVMHVLGVAPPGDFSKVPEGTRA